MDEKHLSKPSAPRSGNALLSWIETSLQARVAVPLLLALGSFALFLTNLDSPEYLYFDEERYIPAARALLTHGENVNWAHPNFGKIMMAIGLTLFGDQPLGWRIMSALFGALSIIGVYWFGWAVFRSRVAAAQGALLALFNQLVFVQARIATLDIFATGFLMPAVAVFALTWTDESLASAKKRAMGFASAGVLFGLAIAAKWIAIVPLLTCIALFVFQKKDDRMKRFFEAGVPGLALAILVYAISLVPTLGMSQPDFMLPGAGEGVRKTYGVMEILRLQLEMFRTHFSYLNPHPYYSSWYTWPLQLRPIWYHRDIWPGGDSQSAVVLIGNPLIMWTGCLAVLYCAWRAIRSRDTHAILLITLYLPLLLCWGVVPRAASFFYYYLPPSLFLGPMLVYAARELRLNHLIQALYLVAAVGVFAFFYPVLANVVISAEAMKARFWFPSWW